MHKKIYIPICLFVFITLTALWFLHFTISLQNMEINGQRYTLPIIRCNVSMGDDSQQYCIACLKGAKKEDLKCSQLTYTHRNVTM